MLVILHHLFFVKYPICHTLKHAAYASTHEIMKLGMSISFPTHKYLHEAKHASTLKYKKYFAYVNLLLFL